MQMPDDALPIVLSDGSALCLGMVANTLIESILVWFLSGVRSNLLDFIGRSG